MKHTPGPWKTRAGKEGSIVLIEDGQRSSVIAFMQGYGEELNANARLIAAAPDLLEACKLMFPLINNRLIGSGAVTSDRAFYNQVIVACEKMETAIQKAEAES